MESIIISRQKYDTSVLEAYKTLRTNLQFCGADVRTIAVTSCVPDEGKSTTSFALAESLAEAGKKVVFLDADLRRSVFVSKYRVSGGSMLGMTHYLSGQSELVDVLYETNFPNLYVVLAGPFPPNPAELLGGKLFENQIAILRESFDYVIIDTPPLGRVIDCAVVARICDGIVMVVESGQTSSKLAQSVKQQIEKTNCPLLGVVLNKVNISSRSYYGYGYGYGRHYRAYGETENQKK